jgi:chemotaxis protein CheY-P-specific phosphatase CheC
MKAIAGGIMDALAEQLDAKLREWTPDTAAQVRQRVAEIIALADQDVLDIMRSRTVEQEVLDLLDAPAPR